MDAPSLHVFLFNKERRAGGVRERHRAAWLRGDRTRIFFFSLSLPRVPPHVRASLSSAVCSLFHGGSWKGTSGRSIGAFRHLFRDKAECSSVFKTDGRIHFPSSCLSLPETESATSISVNRPLLIYSVGVWICLHTYDVRSKIK